MTKRILAIFMLILLAATITQTAFAAANPPYGTGWNSPSHYSNYYYLPPQQGDAMPWSADSTEYMSDSEFLIRKIAANVLVLILVPIFLEILIALVTGIVKIKPIVVSAVLLNTVMQGLITLWVYADNVKPVLPFLLLHISVCFIKFLIYKKAFEFRYTEQKVKSYVLTIGVFELVYFLLIF